MNHNPIFSMNHNPRLLIAKDLLAAMMSNPAFVYRVNDRPVFQRSKDYLSSKALEYADELIKQSSNNSLQ